MRLENTTTTRNQSYADIYISTIHSPGESTFSCACARAELSSPHLELIWSNVLQMFKTSVVVSSPPVHQLNCVGNRLPCSMLLSLCTYLVLMCFSSLVMSRLNSSAQLAIQTPTHTHCCSCSITWKVSNLTPACLLARRPAHGWPELRAAIISPLGSPGISPSPLKASLTPPAK